jgi:hypothetical protein
MTTAHAKVLGFYTSTTTLENLDGAVWLNLDKLSQYQFKQNGPVSELYDATGILLHEISEVMGRVSSLGLEPVINNAYVPLDLFRYTIVAGQTTRFIGNNQLLGDPSVIKGYFSIDGVKLEMQYDNGQNGVPPDLSNGVSGTQGDFADWINPRPNPSPKATVIDAFAGVGRQNQSQCVTMIDLREMNIIGWQLAAKALSTASQCVPTSLGP